METQTKQRERERERERESVRLTRNLVETKVFSFSFNSQLFPSVIQFFSLCSNFSLSFSFFYVLVVVRKLFLSLQKLLSNLVGDERRDRTERIVQKNLVFLFSFKITLCRLCLRVI